MKYKKTKEQERVEYLSTVIEKSILVLQDKELSETEDIYQAIQQAGDLAAACEELHLTEFHNWAWQLVQEAQTEREHREDAMQYTRAEPLVAAVARALGIPYVEGDST